MQIYEAIAVANRLESIARRANTFGPKTREDILEEILDMAMDFRKHADAMDRAMEAEYQKELAAAK